MRSPCSGPWASSGARSSTANRSGASAGPPLLGRRRRRSGSRRRRPGDPGRPPPGCAARPARARPAARCTGTTVDCTSPRPAGSSVSVEVSRSPKTVIATVRGIGVAVITSTCGGVPALPVSAARCSTPNRCCSSTTTRPRSKNWTFSSSSAWVPITMPASPEAASSIACAARGGAHRAGEQHDPGRRPRRPPAGRPRRGRRASPGSTAGAAGRAPRSAPAGPPAPRSRPPGASPAARRASCPSPTSPCRSRCIGWAAASSPAISSPTRS